MKVTIYTLFPDLIAPYTAEALFLTGGNATVGAAMLIKSQTPAVIEAIRAQITSAVAGGFAEGAGYRVPVPVALITARRA